MPAQESPVPNRPGVLLQVYKGLADNETSTLILPRLAFFNESSSGLFNSPADQQLRLSTEVSAPIRDFFTFKLHFRGSLRLFINNERVYEGQSDGTTSVITEEVRLHRGANELRIEFESFPMGDSWLRTQWSCLDFDFEPIRTDTLSFRSSPEIEQAMEWQRGRELYTQYHCHNCHAIPGLPDVLKNWDAPSLDSIGSRLSLDWIQNWILNPIKHRPSARMPKLLHGESSNEEAQKITTFLVSIAQETPSNPDKTTRDTDLITEGKHLYESLLCSSCHRLEDPELENPDPFISLSGVNQKFKEGALFAFLQAPSKFHEFTRMPDFQLTPLEATALAAYLRSKAYPPNPQQKFQSNPVDIAQGKSLLKEKGCLQCHKLQGFEPQIQFAPSMDTLARAGKTEAGCLNKLPGTGNHLLPIYNLNPKQHKALVTFVSDLGLLIHPMSTIQTSAFLIETFQCRNCHTGQNGFPGIEDLGAKLQPDWIQSFLQGQIKAKPRHWLQARMPTFKAWAEDVSIGMAHAHGFSGDPVPAFQPDPEWVEAGRKLVSNQSGFSCISCHPVKNQKALQSQESEGINLALSGERLRQDYFHRWLTAPMRLDPQTKMPTYFEHGRSPLFNILDGDAEKQIQALWHYIGMGTEIPVP